MPLPGERLIVEPSHPAYELLKEIDERNLPSEKPRDSEYEDWKVVNSWYARSLQCRIVILRRPDGSLTWGKEPAFHHVKYDLGTMGCSVAWSIESEAIAIQTLATMLSHHMFKAYLLTGMFLETSKRSGITYMFRKLKPTVAISNKEYKTSGGPKILAALCMHPIGYYADTWAGAMCPTDDVIAHLQMMRADEHMYWKRCNQHQAWTPESGL